MSVLIKGMEMPESCKKCGVTSCGLYDAETWGIYRHPDCPLVEVPIPHGRLIDADATMKQWGLDKATKYGNENAEQQHFSYSSMMMYEVVDILDDAPIVIEAEDE